MSVYSTNSRPVYTKPLAIPQPYYNRTAVPPFGPIAYPRYPVPYTNSQLSDNRPISLSQSALIASAPLLFLAKALNGTSFQTIGLLIAGGSLGTLTRYGLSKLLNKSGASVYGTLAANLIGSFGMGVAMGLFKPGTTGPSQAQLFTTVGFLGGLTTFSALEGETFKLVLQDQPQKAALYLGGSTILGFASLWLGYSCARAVAKSLKIR